MNYPFLYGSLDEDVYMVQLPSFINTNYPSYFYRLRKALYGLKQAPCVWYQALKSFLRDYSFANSHADTTLFIFNHDGIHICFLVYIDDLLVIGSNNSTSGQLLHALYNRFSIMDLGSLSYF